MQKLKFFKGKFGVILIVLATVVLATVAIFTAYRLYTTRTESVAPNVPQSIPLAQQNQTQSCTALAFNLTQPTPSPMSSPTPTTSPSPGTTPNPTPTPVLTPGATPTAQPEASSTPALPEAGVSNPTLFGLGIGTVLLIISVALAL